MMHHIGTVEREMGWDFGREPMGFRTTTKNKGLTIHSKTNTRKILRA